MLEGVGGCFFFAGGGGEFCERFWFFVGFWLEGIVRDFVFVFFSGGRGGDKEINTMLGKGFFG